MTTYFVLVYLRNLLVATLLNFQFYKACLYILCQILIISVPKKLKKLLKTFIATNSITFENQTYISFSKFNFLTPTA